MNLWMPKAWGAKAKNSEEHVRWNEGFNPCPSPKNPLPLPQLARVSTKISTQMQGRRSRNDGSPESLSTLLCITKSRNIAKFASEPHTVLILKRVITWQGMTSWPSRRVADTEYWGGRPLGRKTPDYDSVRQARTSPRSSRADSVLMLCLI